MLNHKNADSNRAENIIHLFYSLSISLLASFVIDGNICLIIRMQALFSFYSGFLFERGCPMPTTIPVPLVTPSNTPDNASEQTRHPGLLEKVRERLRVRHYSLRTEEAYLGWIKRFVWFHDMRHP